MPDTGKVSKRDLVTGRALSMRKPAKFRTTAIVTDVLEKLPGPTGNFYPAVKSGLSFSLTSACIALKDLPPDDTLLLVPAYKVRTRRTLHLRSRFPMTPEKRLDYPMHALLQLLHLSNKHYTLNPEPPGSGLCHKGD